MVAAGVIWKFMYDYRPPGEHPDRHAERGRSGCSGSDRSPWLQIDDTLALNTFALIVVMAWMWTGFAMVIISAALKGISAELLEAARVDGATEWQVFRRIVFPLLVPTIAVVSTTMIITALKAFDIVYVMTGGNYDTDVIANLMYQGDVQLRRLRPGQRARRGPPARDRPGHGSSTSAGSGPRRPSDDRSRSATTATSRSASAAAGPDISAGSASTSPSSC